MKLNIAQLNKDYLKRIMKEELERDEFTIKTVKRQIDEGKTYGKPEEFQQMYETLLGKQKKFQFILSMLPKGLKEVDVNDKELEYFDLLVNNQICISKSRLKDWEDGGCMYNAFKLKCSEEQFQKGLVEIRQYDKDNIECANNIAAQLNIEIKAE